LPDTVNIAQPCGGDVQNSTLEQYANVHMAYWYLRTILVVSSEHTMYAETIVMVK
jgi:hypothetical protein